MNRKLQRIILDLEDLYDESSNLQIKEVIEKLKGIYLYDNY